MSTYDNTDQIIIFPNNKANSENSPTFTGHFELGEELMTELMEQSFGGEIASKLKGRFVNNAKLPVSLWKRDKCISGKVNKPWKGDSMDKTTQDDDLPF
jgi:hypothetical protein